MSPAASRSGLRLAARPPPGSNRSATGLRRRLVDLGFRDYSGLGSCRPAPRTRRADRAPRDCDSPDLRKDATACDAMYPAPAEAPQAALPTCDSALASLPEYRASVEVIG